MSITWLKLDHHIITDVKLRRFSMQEKWAWITLLCLASQNDNDRGKTQNDFEDIADVCGYEESEFIELLGKLKRKGFINFSSNQIEILSWEEKYEPPKHLYRTHPYRKHQAFVFERDGFKCVYCGSEKNLTLDHKIPQSRGGSHDPENLATCCSTCNSSKGAKTPQEWMEAVSL